MIFPRRDQPNEATNIFKLFYEKDARASASGEAFDATAVFQSPRNRVRCFLAHSQSLYRPFLYLY